MEEKIIEIIRSNKWYYQSATVKAFFLEGPCHGLVQDLKPALSLFVTKDKKFYEAWYIETELNGIARDWVKKQASDPTVFRQRFNDCELEFAHSAG